MRNRTGELSAAVSQESSLAVPVNSRAVAQPHLNKIEKIWNPYLLNPAFDHRCLVCSSSHCSRYIKDTRVPNCKKWRETSTVAPTRRLCDYRRCRRPYLHYTVVCPFLHGRCPECSCRGHDHYDQCDVRNASIMERLRDDFEEFANVGLLTRRRAQEVVWGFYPIPPSAPRGTDPFFSYQRVMDMPVADALDFVRALVAAPKNQRDPPESLGEDTVFLRLPDPRPAPPAGWADWNSETNNPGPY